jgi:RNA polymerase-binding transcription factor
VHRMPTGVRMPRSRLATVGALHGEPAGRPQDPLALRLPALRAALEQQLRFRREQLAELEAGGPEPGHSAAHSGRGEEAVYGLREVDALVAAGARRALADIELALVRMRTGRYGCCRACGGHIPLGVLQAIPKTTLCLGCQQLGGRSDDTTVPGASRGTTPHRGETSTGQEHRNRQRRKRRGRAATAGPAKRSEAR